MNEFSLTVNAAVVVCLAGGHYPAVLIQREGTLLNDLHQVEEILDFYWCIRLEPLLSRLEIVSRITDCL